MKQGFTVGRWSRKAQPKKKAGVKRVWNTLNKPREIYTGNTKTIKIMLLGLVLLWVSVSILLPPAKIVPSAHADYNTTFSHTRTPIYLRQSSWDTSLWTYNSTCVSFATTEMRFAYDTGTTGSGGNNCNSADIAISKASINFATATNKQLEMSLGSAIAATNCLSANCYSHISFSFRQNATLPSFTENYDPTFDPRVRLWIYMCPQINTASGCNPNGIVNAHAGTDFAQSLQTEGLSTSLIIGTTFPGTIAGSTANVQLVLNYTGSTQFISTTPGGSSAATKIVTGLSPGLDYYLLVKATFDNTISPRANVRYAFTANTGGAGANAFGIWTVPVSCHDPLNTAVAPCNAAAPAGYSAPSLDDLNLFDPRTWVNALVKLGIWALSEALKLAMIVVGNFATVLVSMLNTLGQIFGLGAIGTQISNFFATVISDITNIFANFFAWAQSASTLIGNAFSALASLLGTYFTQIGAFFTGLLGIAGFLWTVVSDVTKYASLPFGFFFTLWWAWGMYEAYDNGPAGLMSWLDTSEVILFKGLNIVIWFGEKTLDVLAKLRTILPRPFGI